MLTQIGVTLLYRLYCINKWEHCKFKLSLDREFLRPLLSYSGWDLFGNASLVARTQGVNILLRGASIKYFFWSGYECGCRDCYAGTNSCNVFCY